MNTKKLSVLSPRTCIEFRSYTHSRHTQFLILIKKSHTFIPANGASPWNSSRQSVELDSDTELECNDPLDAVDL